LRSGGLSHVVILPGHGFFKSEPGYGIPVDAEFEHGADYIRADPDLAHLRLEVASLLKDKATGGFIRFNYTGVIRMDGAAAVVLGGKPGAKTTDFGEIGA